MVNFEIFRKPCSGYKMKEMTGSGIFAANGEDDAAESGSANPTPNSKTGIRMYQVPITLFLIDFIPAYAPLFAHIEVISLKGYMIRCLIFLYF